MMCHHTSRADPDTLDLYLRLFEGHPIPGLCWRRFGWCKAPKASRKTVFAAHLAGIAIGGNFPFMGIINGCGCSPTRHTCDGRGTRYTCWDLDAHHGETDVELLKGRLLYQLHLVGAEPLEWTSGSGTGVHLYVFYDRPIPTSIAFAFGRYITQAANVPANRCDIIPSGNHFKGIGTQHRLPGGDTEPGGGVMLRGERVVAERSEVLSLMNWTDRNRLPAGVAHTYAAADPEPNVKRRKRRRKRRQKSPMVADGVIFKALKKSSPDFSSMVSSGPGENRSGWDVKLASAMLRQGMSHRGVVDALMSLPGTKSVSRGRDFAASVVVYAVASQKPDDRLYAGAPDTYRARRTPWKDRVPPPLQYGDVGNPWWKPEVQQRFNRHGGLVVAVMTAHLIDRWYRGPAKFRPVFMGRNRLVDDLGFTPRRVQAAVDIIEEHYGDLLRVRRGKRHPVLRVANSFDVVSGRQAGRSVLYCAGHERSDDRTYADSPSQRYVRPESRHSVSGWAALA